VQGLTYSLLPRLRGDVDVVHHSKHSAVDTFPTWRFDVRVQSAVNRGDNNFARVYEEHLWIVYGFLAYRLRDQAAAEDLTQATFERALRAWSRFDPRKGSERTWLLAIARNLLIDHHRRDHSSRIEIDEGMLPAVAGPEARLTASHEIVEALSRLGDRDREVIALRFGGDLTGPEIATLLGLTLANVQQILSRSLRKLRSMLDDTGFSELSGKARAR
jgi:RNA polymerase sigma factor (sigma-70 family)